MISLTQDVLCTLRLEGAVHIEANQARACRNLTRPPPAASRVIFKGVRTFELKPGPGSTDFSMREHFSGFVFALVKGKLPDFRPIFETYAGDLKREAERIAQPQVNIRQLRSGGRTFL